MSLRPCTALVPVVWIGDWSLGSDHNAETGDLSYVFPYCPCIDVTGTFPLTVGGRKPDTSSSKLFHIPGIGQPH